MAVKYFKDCSLEASDEQEEEEVSFMDFTSLKDFFNFLEIDLDRPYENQMFFCGIVIQGPSFRNSPRYLRWKFFLADCLEKSFSFWRIQPAVAQICQNTSLLFAMFMRAMRYGKYDKFLACTSFRTTWKIRATQNQFF